MPILQVSQDDTNFKENLLTYFRYKKCKAVGMRYRDPDNILHDNDGRVTITKELFEARQRELQETSCQKKIKNMTVLTESSIKKSTKMELKSSLFNRIREKEKKNKQIENPMEYYEGISNTFGSPEFNSLLLKDTISEQILANQVTKPPSIIESIENIEALQTTVQTNNVCKMIGSNSNVVAQSNQSCKQGESEKSDSFPIEIACSIGRIPLNPGLKFTTEERQRVDHLLKLDQSIVISFDDLEHDVAVKVLLLQILTIMIYSRLFKRCLTKHFLS